MEKNVKKTGFAAHPENINRKGRPKKGKTITDLIKKLGKRRIEIESINGKHSKLEIIVEQLLLLAMEGDVSAIKYIVDRIDGKPTETVKHEGDMTYIIKPAEGDSAEN